MRRARCFRTDLVAGIFQFDPSLAQRLKGGAEMTHVGDMKRHMTEHTRMRRALVQDHRHVVVTQAYVVFATEKLFEIEQRAPPRGALLGVAHRKAKVADNSERYLHFSYLNRSRLYSRTT